MLRKFGQGIEASSTFYLALFLLLTCWNSSLWAQDSATVIIGSFGELEKLVTESNPDLKSYQLNIEKAQKDLSIAKAYRLPTASATFNSQNNLSLATTPVPGEFFGQPGSTVNVQFGQEYTYNAGVTIQKNLFDIEALQRMKKARLGIGLANAQEQNFQEKLAQQACYYYHTALVAKRSVKLWQKDLDLADSLKQLAQKKHDEGLLNALSLNQAKINALMVQQNLNSSQQLYEQCLTELRVLVGLNSKEPLTLTEELSYELPKRYTVEKLQSSPELALASIQKQQAEIQVNVQKAALLPKLSLTSYFGKQQFNEEFGLNFGNDSWTNYSYLGLNLNIPIFSGFANRNRLKSSKIELDRAQLSLQSQTRTLASQDQRLVEDYLSSLKNAQLANEAMQLYQTNQELTYQQYSEGLVSLDRYLSSFEEYLKAESSFINALSNSYSYYSQILPRVK